MADKTRVEALEAKNDSLISKRNAELKKLEDALANDKAAAAEALEELHNATVGNNLDAYRMAKDKKELSEATQELHTERIKLLKEDALVDAETFKKEADGVLEEVEAEDMEAKKKVAELLRQAIEICENDGKTIERANKAIRRMQIELLKDKEIYANKVGSILESKIVSYNDLKLPGFGSYLSSSYGYKEITK